MSSDDGAWGQLVCTTDLDSDPIPLNNDKFYIGRAKGCNLSISANKLLSGRHCHLERRGDGQVLLHDTSTNGTLLNTNTRICNQSKEIEHGDEIHLVFRKNETDSNLAYIYQEMAQLHQEELDATQDSSEVLDATLPCQMDFIDDAEPVGKKPKLVDESKTITDKAKTHDPKQSNKSAINTKNTKTDPATCKDGKNDLKSAEKQLKSDMKSVEKESKNDQTDTQENTQAETSDKGTSKTKTEECKTTVSDAAVAGSDKDVGKDAGTEASDEIEESLLCVICQEILHDCISLQPCMHSFCGGCYSDWMKRSNECPSCRLKVERINKNHIVNNLVQAYLKHNPGKRRPQEDIDRLNEQNTITNDMLYSKRPAAESDEDESDGSSSHSGSLSGSLGSLGTYTRRVGGCLLTVTRPAFYSVPVPKTVCRQCPEYTGPHKAGAATAGTTGAQPASQSQSASQPDGTITTTTGATYTEAGPSNPNPGASSEVKAGPSTAGTAQPQAATGTAQPQAATGTAQPQAATGTVGGDFVCGANQDHCVCQCCLQPFPDRRNERNKDPRLPLTQCGICWRLYCHNYWGCTRLGCRGCMAPFRDLNFGEDILNNVILQNAHESAILKDFLVAQGLTVKDMHMECMTKLDNKQYLCSDYPTKVADSRTVLCYSCGLKNLRDLAYLYRSNIPRDKLPEDVRKRPNCHWGKSCRTQRHKPLHAQNYNHICDQTRF